MLVSGSGDVKITKDGNVLLHEMQIQHPTASLIARASTAQDDVTGDGTTSTVLLIGEMLRQAELYVGEGLHPRAVVEGFEAAKAKALQVLEGMKVPLGQNETEKRETLCKVASTSLKTKVHPKVSPIPCPRHRVAIKGRRLTFASREDGETGSRMRNAR